VRRGDRPPSPACANDPRALGFSCLRPRSSHERLGGRASRNSLPPTGTRDYDRDSPEMAAAHSDASSDRPQAAIPFAAAIITMLVGATGLAGWIFDVEALKSIVATITMKATWPSRLRAGSVTNVSPVCFRTTCRPSPRRTAIGRACRGSGKLARGFRSHSRAGLAACGSGGLPCSGRPQRG
jgi:hypothetical protein